MAEGVDQLILIGRNFKIFRNIYLPEGIASQFYHAAPVSLDVLHGLLTKAALKHCFHQMVMHKRCYRFQAILRCHRLAQYFLRLLISEHTAQNHPRLRMYGILEGIVIIDKRFFFPIIQVLPGRNSTVFQHT